MKQGGIPGTGPQGSVSSMVYFKKSLWNQL